MDWQPISTAPEGPRIELAVIDNDEVHAIVFPCRRAEGEWVNAETGRRVEIRPTHWRRWREAVADRR